MAFWQQNVANKKNYDVIIPNNVKEIQILGGKFELSYNKQNCLFLKTNIKISMTNIPITNRNMIRNSVMYRIQNWYYKQPEYIL